MMHPVEPPQQRHAVCRHVPSIQRVVQQQDGPDRLRPARQAEPGEKAEAVALYRTGDRRYDGAAGNLHRGRGHARHRKIAGGAAQGIRLLPRAQRAFALRDRQGGEGPQHRQAADHPGGLLPALPTRCVHHPACPSGACAALRPGCVRSADGAPSRRSGRAACRGSCRRCDRPTEPRWRASAVAERGPKPAHSPGHRR